MDGWMDGKSITKAAEMMLPAVLSLFQISLQFLLQF